MDNSDSSQSGTENLTESTWEAVQSAGSTRRRKVIKALGCAGIILLSCFVGIVLCSYGLKRTFAHRQTYALNAQAKMVCNAAAAYQQQLQDEGAKYRFQTTVFNLKDDRTDDTLYQGIYRYDSNVEKESFAVICDENGIVTGAMASKGKITEYDLTHPQTFEEQRSYLRSFFRSKKAIGSYLNGCSPEPNAAYQNEP